MSETIPTTIHATTVAIGGRAVALRGASGAGKSDLALRLIDRGAVLVADDRTLVRSEGATAYASAPAVIAGQLEVRGLGIVAQPVAGATPLALVVDLGVEERMPEPRYERIGSALVRAITLDSRPASAAIKLELALRLLAGERA